MRDYKRFSIHDDSLLISLAFTLCLSMVISTRKPAFQPLNEADTSQNNNLRKTRTIKRLFYQPEVLNYSFIPPLNLKIIPHSGAEIALKKQMNSIFNHCLLAKYTIIIIVLQLPIPPSNHVLGVKPIMK